MSQRWRLRGRPTYCIIIREDNMKDPQFPELLNLLLEIRNLKVDNVKISLGRLQNLMSSACLGMISIKIYVYNNIFWSQANQKFVQ